MIYSHFECSDLGSYRILGSSLLKISALKEVFFIYFTFLKIYNSTRVIFVGSGPKNSIIYENQLSILYVMLYGKKHKNGLNRVRKQQLSALSIFFVIIGTNRNV